jgi:hypothetical protein
MNDTIKDAGVPVIHMNGSSKQSLLKEWQAFNDALETVCEKFPFESFHPRNHYVKDGDGEGLAEVCKAEMCEHLHALKTRSTEIISGILAQ